MRLALSPESAPTTPEGAPLFVAPREVYLAQKREYMRHRGAIVVGAVAVPKTTLADVLELTTWWTGELDKLRLARALTDDDRAAIAAWRGCLDVISRRAQEAPRDAGATALYRDNAHVWTSVAGLADHLTRAQVMPSWWPGARAAIALAPNVAGAVDRIGDRLAQNVGKISGAAGRAAGGAAVESAVTAAVVPLSLAAGGIVGAILLLRATSPAARARRDAARAAKGGRR